MKMLHFVVPAILITFQSQAADIEVSGHGTLHLELAGDWKEVSRTEFEGLPPSIKFRSGTPRASLQVTAAWSRAAEPAFTKPATLEKLTLMQQRAVAPTAVEAKVDVVPFQGKVGYWFTATDKNYNPSNPKDYAVVSQGHLAIGEVLLAFTLLSDSKDSDAVRQALHSLRTATLKPMLEKK